VGYGGHPPNLSALPENWNEGDRGSIPPGGMGNVSEAPPFFPFLFLVQRLVLSFESDCRVEFISFSSHSFFACSVSSQDVSSREAGWANPN
jgi:hypothetical protein